MNLWAVLIFGIFCPVTILIFFLIIYAFHDQYNRLNDNDKDLND